MIALTAIRRLRPRAAQFAILTLIALLTLTLDVRGSEESIPAVDILPPPGSSGPAIQKAQTEAATSAGAPDSAVIAKTSKDANPQKSAGEEVPGPTKKIIADDAPKSAGASPENKAGAEPPLSTAKEKTDASKTPEAEETKKADGGDAAKAEVVEEVIPPPPEPTADDLEKRKTRALDFESLGGKLFDYPVTGTSVTRFRARRGAGDHDEDLYEFVSMDFGDKDRQSATEHFDLRYDADLSDRRTGSKADVFSGIVDTYSSARDLELYSAYTDFHKIPGIEFLRAGRQWNYDTSEVLPFDGVRLDTAPVLGKHELKFSFYGGVPVYSFALVPNGGSMGGAAVEGRPWKSMRMRLDFTHIDEDYSQDHKDTLDPLPNSLNPGTGYLHNDLASFSLWQVFQKPNVQLQARVSELDGRARDGFARAVYNKNELNLQVIGSYNVWFNQQPRLVNQYDMYFDTLAGQEPYQNASLVVSKGWTDNVWTEGGAVVRRLTHSGTETTFNHEFDQYYASLQLRDLLLKGLMFSVTGSRWDGRGQSPASDELGGEISYKAGKRFQTSAGTDYALYKYDLFLGNELDQVRTYYLKQRWKPTRWTALDVNYEREHSLKRSFDTWTVTFRIDF